TQGFFHVRIAAEIRRRRVLRCGDDIPSGPAAAEVIQRGELRRDQERFVETGGQGRDNAKLFGDARDGGADRNRVEVVDRDLAHHAASAFARRQRIADEQLI